MTDTDTSDTQPEPAPALTDPTGIHAELQRISYVIGQLATDLARLRSSLAGATDASKLRAGEVMPMAGEPDPQRVDYSPFYDPTQPVGASFQGGAQMQEPQPPEHLPPPPPKKNNG